MRNLFIRIRAMRTLSVWQVLVGVFLGAAITLLILYLGKPDFSITPLPSSFELPLARIYDRYSFTSLKKRTFASSPIKLDRVLTKNEDFTSYLFSFTSDGKRVTGQANIPTSEPPSNGFPVIIQMRGFVEHEIYQTGVGTAPSAAVYAQNGFITLAPDFLGYGESDPGASDDLLDRFENPVVVLNLLASVPSLPKADAANIFLWGHSNGGQIVLSVLEISGRPIATVLWAPVSKAFPYSILYYTDQAPDGGKYLRKIIADFERKGYDVDNYSITTYLADITAPLELHQGTDDKAVPLSWSNAFVEKMKTLGKDISYYVYPGADHNLRGSWNTVVARDLAFFKNHIK